MAHAKAKAKGLPCPSEPLKPYTPTLNGKFFKARDNQRYWGFLEPRYDLELKTMVPIFELFFDYDNKLPEPKKEDTNWVPTDWVDFMDPNAICNMEACQHALKSSYEVRTDDEDKEGGETPSDDDEGSDNKSDSNNSSSDNRDSGDNNSSDSDNSSSEDYDSQYSGNDRGKPPDDSEDEDVIFFYEEHFDDDVDYYDGDVEDDIEAMYVDIENDIEAENVDIKDDVEVEDEKVEEGVEAEGINYDKYPYGRPLDWSCITDFNSISGPRYDKHGREIPELGSFHNSKHSSLTPYTKEEDDIDARLTTLD